MWDGVRGHEHAAQPVRPQKVVDLLHSALQAGHILPVAPDEVLPPKVDTQVRASPRRAQLDLEGRGCLRHWQWWPGSLLEALADSGSKPDVTVDTVPGGPARGTRDHQTRGPPSLMPLLFHPSNLGLWKAPPAEEAEPWSADQRPYKVMVTKSCWAWACTPPDCCPGHTPPISMLLSGHAPDHAPTVSVLPLWPRPTCPSPDHTLGDLCPAL